MAGRTAANRGSKSINERLIHEYSLKDAAKIKRESLREFDNIVCMFKGYPNGKDNL